MPDAAFRHGCGAGKLHCHTVHLDKMAQEHEPKPPSLLGASITPDSPGTAPRSRLTRRLVGGALGPTWLRAPSEYHDWAFNARRVLTRADERFAGLLQWISGTIDEIKESDVLEYRRTKGLSTVDWTG